MGIKVSLPRSINFVFSGENFWLVQLNGVELFRVDGKALVHTHNNMCDWFHRGGSEQFVDEKLVILVGLSLFGLEVECNWTMQVIYIMQNMALSRVNLPTTPSFPHPGASERPAKDREREADSKMPRWKLI